METLHEARFYEPLPDKRVLCMLCPHDCRIPDGRRGACAVRYNDGGTLYTLVYDKLVCREVDPVEKKPLFHFYPHSTAYSVATAGCNLRSGRSHSGRRNIWPNTSSPPVLTALRSTSARDWRSSRPPSPASRRPPRASCTRRK